MRTAAEILATWDDEGRFEAWHAVDQHKDGHSRRLFVGDWESAQAKAFDLMSYPSATYYRYVRIPADEARRYFEEQVSPSEWISRYEAMDMLGVGESRISQLVKSGKIAANGSLVSRHDVEQRKIEGPKRGRPRKYNYQVTLEALQGPGETISESKKQFETREAAQAYFDSIDLAQAWRDEIDRSDGLQTMMTVTVRKSIDDISSAEALYYSTLDKSNSQEYGYSDYKDNIASASEARHEAEEPSAERQAHLAQALEQLKAAETDVEEA